MTPAEILFKKVALSRVKWWQHAVKPSFDGRHRHAEISLSSEEEESEEAQQSNVTMSSPPPASLPGLIDGCGSRLELGERKDESSCTDNEDTLLEGVRKEIELQKRGLLFTY